MGKVGIGLTIDVSKIDKSKLIKGKKGVYLDAQIFVNLIDADQYGNHGMITQSQTKQERQAGGQGAILGNGKIFWREESNVQPIQTVPGQAVDAPTFDDDIPF